jgi:hypothetical protein
LSIVIITSAVAAWLWFARARGFLQIVGRFLAYLAIFELRLNVKKWKKVVIPKTFLPMK